MIMANKIMPKINDQKAFNFCPKDKSNWQHLEFSSTMEEVLEK